MNSTLSRYFDIRSGTIAAVLMGSIVWWINADYGALAASTAALKQAGYTFFMGGVIIQFCKTLYKVLNIGKGSIELCL